MSEAAITAWRSRQRLPCFAEQKILRAFSDLSAMCGAVLWKTAGANQT